MNIFENFTEYAILIIILCLCVVYSSLQLYRRAFKFIGTKMLISAALTLYILGLLIYFLYISYSLNKHEKNKNHYKIRLFFDLYISIFVIFFLLFYGIETYRKVTKALDPNEIVV